MSGFSRLPLHVDLVPERGSWIALPPTLAAQLLDAGAELPLIVQLVPLDAIGAPARGARPLFAAWQGSTLPSEGALGVPAALANCLGLRRGAPVQLRPLAGVPAAEAVIVEPLSGDDWEVLELNAGHLEDQLLEQVGVVAPGQALTLWARQAPARLMVTSLLPDGLAVARLAPGTEVHIAPQPRVGATGGNGGDGQPAAGAGREAVAAAVAAGQSPRRVWLRVLEAGPECLLGAGVPPGEPQRRHGGQPVHTTQEVQSWLTCAALTSNATAASQRLALGRPAQLCSCGGAAAAPPAGGGGGGAAAPPQLVVQLVADDSLPWGHVALAPPLMAALGLRPLQYVRIEQAVEQPDPQLLGSCPMFELRPLVEQTDLDDTHGNGQSDGGAADGAASATPPQQRQQQQQHPQLRRGSDAGSDRSGAGGGWAAGLVSGLHGVLMGGLPLPGFGDLLAGSAAPMMLSDGLLGARGPQQLQKQRREQELQQRRLSAAAAAAAQAAEGGQAASAVAAAGALPPGVSATAVDTWLRMQLAALVARAAVGAGVAPAAARRSEAALPMCGPLLMHFRVGAAAPGSAVDARPASPIDRGADSARPLLQPRDHLMVLFPQLPASCHARPPAWWALPPGSLGGEPPQHGRNAVLPPAPIKVSIGQPLAAPAPLASPAAQRHAPHVSVPSLDLQRDAFAWLSDPLSSAARRLAPRLDLRRWAAVRRASLPSAGGPLVCGGSGSGKSALLHLLGASLQARPGPVGGDAPVDAATGAAAERTAPAHVLVVSCRGLAGARFERAAGAIGAAVAEVMGGCPGAVLLDDLDMLCPAPGDGPEQASQDSETAVRLAEWLTDLMRWAGTQARPVAFAASARDAAALPASLRQAGCLDCELRLPAPGAPGRAAMLLRGIRDRGCALRASVAAGVGVPDADAAAAAAALTVSEKADGFDAKDLQAVLDRAVHFALRRQLAGGGGGGLSPAVKHGGGGDGGGLGAEAGAGAAKGQQQPSEEEGSQQQQQQQGQQEEEEEGGLVLTPADLEAALEGFVPAAFRGVGRTGGGARGGGGGGGGAPEGWQDVGGLAEAKAALTEALELPIKWRHLVARAPLRLRTGLLLYGPPGCGKTHVVGAAVAAVDAHLITVKGPELLNKYIGASEAAVRDLFSRAAAAAPCVLFFDEVVNQLLTELDGVEGLKGVTVLAATSRPDLIDAALLRPGRLDRLVHCGMPDEAACLAILRAASRRTPLAPDADLAALAAHGAAAGLSGADLAALLSEAQLAAVHEELAAREVALARRAAGAAEAAGAAGAGGAPRVADRHLRAALLRARPSLPRAERARLEGIYSRFMEGRDPEIANRQARADAKGKAKRATLA